MKKIFLYAIVLCSAIPMLHAAVTKRDSTAFEQAFDQWNGNRSNNDLFNNACSKYSVLKSASGGRAVYAQQAKNYASARGVDIDSACGSGSNPYAAQAPAPAAPAPAPAPSVSGASEAPGLRVPSAPIPVVPLAPIAPGASVDLPSPAIAAGPAPAGIPEGPSIPAVKNISPYQVLGLPEKAFYGLVLGLAGQDLNDRTAIGSAYRQLSRIWHPDKRDIGIANARYNALNIMGNDRKTLADAVLNLLTQSRDMALEKAGSAPVAPGSPLSSSQASQLNALDQRISAIESNIANLDQNALRSQLEPVVSDFNRFVQLLNPSSDRSLVSKVYQEIVRISAEAYEKGAQGQLSLPASVPLVSIVPGGSLMIVDPSAAIGAILPEGPAVAPVNGVSPYSAMGAPERANYALVLGLSGSDLNDLSVIRKAFRDLSKQWHPDRAPAANQKDLYTATFQIIEDAYKKALNNAGKVSVPAAGSPLSMADTSKLKVIEQQVQAVANNAANMDPATIQSQLQPSVNNFNDVIRSVSPTADRTFINRIYRQIFNIVAPAYAKKQAQQRGQQLTLPAPVVTASTSPKDWEVLQLALTRVKEKNEDFYQPFTELYESIAKKVAQTPITDQAHLTLLAHARDEYDKLKAPQAPQLTGTYAPGKPGAIMPGNIPAPQLRPLKLTDSEWNRLRELNKLADRNQLDSSSDKAEFSRLIDKAKMVLHNNPAAVKEDDKALIASATEQWNMMLS